MCDDNRTSYKAENRRNSYSNYVVSSEKIDVNKRSRQRHDRGDFQRFKKNNDLNKTFSNRSALRDSIFKMRNVSKKTSSRTYRFHRSNFFQINNSEKKNFSADNALITNRILKKINFLKLKNLNESIDNRSNASRSNEH